MLTPFCVCALVMKTKKVLGGKDYRKATGEIPTLKVDPRIIQVTIFLSDIYDGSNFLGFRTCHLRKQGAHPNTLYRCGYCFKSLVTRQNVRVHMKNVHPRAPKKGHYFPVLDSPAEEAFERKKFYERKGENFFFLFLV